MSSARTNIQLNQRKIIFSKIYGRRKIGVKFFQHIHAIEDMNAPPRGLVEDLSEFRSARFRPEELHENIRSFYEETERFHLEVHARWQIGFRFLKHFYKFFSKYIEQLNFPVKSLKEGESLESCILPIRHEVDGRRRVRAWVRSYQRTGEAMYVAAYGTHTRGIQTWMNIAFPIPGGNITCILRVGSMSGGGFELSTFPLSRRIKDEGVYLISHLLAIRLPMQETIRLWVVGMEGIPDELECGAETATLLARHDVWIYGMKVLTLDYHIFEL